MIRRSDWASRFDGFDFSDFAQEFLRRNPDYRADFERSRRSFDGMARSVAARRRARSWGLEFLGRSGVWSRCPTGPLALQSQSCRRHPGISDAGRGRT